ncbi:ribbon-helix-helix domain-containing protein [Devosia naphthalenivorans]|uniref:ribbon-helix-helix domain-containing protein n=1 Tax=Devosia naphthalenivorans TaxID=2082392 RepID=UPI000D3CE5B6|nr:ribbon-helix-helix domain-containing protein [Devosia naphthalenivorans]
MQERITVRMTSEMVARIDAWIASQAGYVSRQDAVRRCVDFALGESHSDRQIGATESLAAAYDVRLET